eukprot:4851695-Pleurochrysis_carterae.AAC.1
MAKGAGSTRSYPTQTHSHVPAHACRAIMSATDKQFRGPVKPAKMATLYPEPSASLAEAGQAGAYTRVTWVRMRAHWDRLHAHLVRIVMLSRGAQRTRARRRCLRQRSSD